MSVLQTQTYPSNNEQVGLLTDPVQDVANYLTAPECLEPAAELVHQIVLNGMLLTQGIEATNLRLEGEVASRVGRLVGAARVIAGLQTEQDLSGCARSRASRITDEAAYRRARRNRQQAARNTDVHLVQ